MSYNNIGRHCYELSMTHRTANEPTTVPEHTTLKVEVKRVNLPAVDCS